MRLEARAGACKGSKWLERPPSRQRQTLLLSADSPAASDAVRHPSMARRPTRAAGGPVPTGLTDGFGRERRPYAWRSATQSGRRFTPEETWFPRSPRGAIRQYGKVLPAPGVRPKTAPSLQDPGRAVNTHAARCAKNWLWYDRAEPEPVAPSGSELIAGQWLTSRAVGSRLRRTAGYRQLRRPTRHPADERPIPDLRRG